MTNFDTICFMLLGLALKLGCIMAVIFPAPNVSPLIIITIGAVGIVTFWIPAIVNLSK